jgi:hypothetical protein
MQQRNNKVDEGIKPQRHKDTELHVVLLRAAVTPWFKKSSVELSSAEVCDATGADSCSEDDYKK